MPLIGAHWREVMAEFDYDIVLEVLGIGGCVIHDKSKMSVLYVRGWCLYDWVVKC